MKKKEEDYSQSFQKPSVFIAIGYEEVYDDFSSINPLELLEGVPTASILKFIAEKFESVFYAQSDILGQRQHIIDFCPYLPDRRKKRVWNFIYRSEKAGNHVYLYGTVGCQMMYRLSLQHFVPLEDGDDIDLCQNEYEPIFKALLYCNSKWTKHQVSEADKNLRDISLKIDIPIAETKHYKDFRPQLFKARQFYSFCESDNTFSRYLPVFLRDKAVNNWGEYLTILFNIYRHSIRSSILPCAKAEEKKFLSQFVIDVNDEKVASLWDQGHKGLAYLRDHFLFELPTSEYLLLDANLLIDKFYQGIKFDLFNSVKNNGLLNAHGKPYKDQRDFNSTLGEVYSERYLLYTLFNKIYRNSGGNAITFTGDELKQNGIEGELDYYLRIDNTLFLIEYKDVLFPDTLRYSDSVEKIKQGIRDRLCRDNGEESRKGGGQLLYNMDRILNHGLMDSLDPDVANVKFVYPLLVTTDLAFSAHGVNLVVSEEFDRIIKSKYHFGNYVVTYHPLVVNYDSLVLLSYRLHTSALQLNKLINSYFASDSSILSSFDNFIWDEYEESDEERKNGLVFLLGDVVNSMVQMTSWMNDNGDYLS